MTSENVARLNANTSVVRGQASIGAILIDVGRLSIADAERVLSVQRQEKLRFGDAGLKLKVPTQADIDFALSRQFSYEILQRGVSRVSERIAAAYDPFSRQAEAFRAMRSHLMLRWFDGDTARKTLAIMSPEPKEGRSFIAANLAVAFSQLGERVLLVDADFRNPVQHLLFGLENRTGLSAVVSARQTAADIERIPGLEHLSVLPAGPTPPNPVELLSLAAFPDLLEDFRNRFDLILIDSPPAAEYADAQIISARVSAAVFVVRKNATKALRARTSLESLRGHTTILGTVLNDF